MTTENRQPVPALYYLIGRPAVGKLTVARELVARLERAVLVDNHLWNDPIFVPGGLQLGAPFQPLNPLRERVRQIVLEATAIAPAYVSHVFTHYLSHDDGETLAEHRALAERRGVRFVPVWLTASDDELLARTANADRSAKAKLTDTAIARDLLAVPALAPEPGALVLDTGRLSPTEAAAAIIASL